MKSPILACLAALVLAASANAATPSAQHRWPTTKPDATYTKKFHGQLWNCQLWIAVDGYFQHCWLAHPAAKRGTASARKLPDGSHPLAKHRKHARR